MKKLSDKVIELLDYLPGYKDEFVKECWEYLQEDLINEQDFNDLMKVAMSISYDQGYTDRDNESDGFKLT